MTFAIALLLATFVAAPPADAEKSDSGLATQKIADGVGTQNPGPDDIVKLRYTIWKPDGSVLESIEGNKSAMMSVSRMMPGWREAVQKMVVGESRRSWIPSSLGGGKIPEGSTYVIETTLLEVINGPGTPPDVAAVPDDATKTRSGLAYRVIKPGNGARKPRRSSTVTVNYSGWTTDGRLFDSTLLRGKPSQFPLDGVIAGWTEGISMMTPGEIRRFWIPAKLAYANDPSKPQGMLVFDIELLSID
jgi:peptidylprolyl isomerase